MTQAKTSQLIQSVYMSPAGYAEGLITKGLRAAGEEEKKQVNQSPARHQTPAVCGEHR